MFVIVVFVVLLGSHLEQARDGLIGVLHEDVLAALFPIAVYHVDGLLQNRPALLHAQIDLVAEASRVDAIGADDDMLVRVARLRSRDEGKLDVFHASKQRLDNPTRDLARIVLDLLCQALRHHQVQVLLPVSLA